MLKSVAPIWGRLRHLHRPRLFLSHEHAPTGTAGVSVGQRLAERVAAFVGSWWFLGGQAFFLFLWLLYNTFQFTHHFDPPPYILLNLLLSFQAAFTGPVLLIAANVGAVRDHQQSDRIEHLAKQSEALSEQNEQLAQRLLSMEQLLDEHVAASLKAHGEEIHDLSVLLREVHAAVCATPSAINAAAGSAGDHHPQEDLAPQVANDAKESAAKGTQPSARQRGGRTPGGKSGPT